MRYRNAAGSRFLLDVPYDLWEPFVEGGRMHEAKLFVAKRTIRSLRDCLRKHDGEFLHILLEKLIIDSSIVRRILCSFAAKFVAFGDGQFSQAFYF